MRYVIRYTGNVQGVGFRMTTVSRASGLAVHGFVRNESDGSVLVDAEGSERDLNELMRRIAATMEDKIDEVNVERQRPLGRTDGFRIEY